MTHHTETAPSRKTQQTKILAKMQTEPSRWWLPQDFMDPDLPADEFVGYEASARLSELAKDGKVQSRRSGRQFARRLIINAKEKNYGHGDPRADMLKKLPTGVYAPRNQRVIPKKPKVLPNQVKMV